MKRLSVMLIFGGLLLGGCRGASDDEPAGKAAQDGQAARQQAKTPIVRALLETIDEVEGKDEDVKNELRRTLRESDRELHRTLGDNSRRLIEQANKKPPAPMINPTAKPPAETKPSDSATTEEPVTKGS